MFVRTRARLAGISLAAAAALLGGCVNNPLSQTGGVLPAGEIGPPPSARADLRTPARSAAATDPDQVVASEPTRRLNIPTAARGAGGADSQARRIRREDLEDYKPSGGGGGGLQPSLGSGGAVGVGGRF
ncbi:conserved hypothetical protein [Methylobacterium sp. 4-46]|uniref:hypothetical protein n=1 Tax=unclassified Methylobacterium TaxID=2615210 RepID=UPI000152D0B4|nr:MULTISPECIES: hypothetical protein [Methylobacterium]ACA15558.1 conserved hypothetical protein [Methylobacterium sp. 4-46]WFT81271.1 hypothetical protein QA634_05085 [Methylobacterium nodulans]